jgi:hypothetical protein
MGLLKIYKDQKALSEMLTFAGWRCGFTESDKAALARDAGVVRDALLQPVGCAAVSRGGREGVSEEEFDRAVWTILAVVVGMWLSGALEACPTVEPRG